MGMALLAFPFRDLVVDLARGLLEWLLPVEHADTLDGHAVGQARLARPVRVPHVQAIAVEVWVQFEERLRCGRHRREGGG